MAFRCSESDCWYQATGQVGVCENRTGGGCPLTYPLVADCVGQMPATKMDSVKQAGILRVNELQKSGQTTVAALVAILGKSPSTVRKAIRNLYPGVTASGRTTYLSTEQAAVVLAGMRRLHGRKRAK